MKTIIFSYLSGAGTVIALILILTSYAWGKRALIQWCRMLDENETDDEP